jgi:hypothetical protein
MGRFVAHAGMGCAVLFQLFVSLAHADVVELTSGQRLDGRVEQVTPSVVVIHRYGGVVTLARENVRAIYLEPGVASAPSLRLAVQDAVEALRRLAEANASSVTHRERTRRLGEAKTMVERYVKSPDGPPGAQESLGAALGYLTLATTALDPALAEGDLAAIGRHPALDRCPHLNEAFQWDVPRLRTGDRARNRGLIVSMFGVGALWRCGVEKIAEAERLIEGKE